MGRQGTVLCLDKFREDRGLTPVFFLSPQGELNPDQSWYFEDTSVSNVTEIEDGAVYQFRARNSGKYMDVNAAGTALGTAILQSTLDFDKHQRFKLTKYEDTDYFTIAPLHAENTLLEVSTTTEANGYTYLQLGDSAVTDRKLFKLEYNSTYQGMYMEDIVEDRGRFYVLTNLERTGD